MSEELKPCNVKECHYYDSRWDCHKGTARIHYTNCNRAYGRNKKTVQDCKLYVAWNTRPIETALREQIEKAEKEVEVYEEYLAGLFEECDVAGLLGTRNNVLVFLKKIGRTDILDDRKDKP